MLKKISMTIPLAPITKKNHSQIITKKLPGGKQRPVLIPSKQYRQYEQQCKDLIVQQGLLIDYPVNVQAIYYMPTRRRGDLTNLHEALHDVLVKCEVLEDDNCKIIAATDGSRVRYDKENPRTEVIITELETDDETLR